MRSILMIGQGVEFASGVGETMEAGCGGIVLGGIVRHQALQQAAYFSDIHGLPLHALCDNRMLPRQNEPSNFLTIFATLCVGDVVRVFGPRRRERGGFGVVFRFSG